VPSSSVSSSQSSTVLRNVQNYSPSDMPSYPWRSESTATLLWEPHI